jgi:ribosomal-protein-alanine N-acetyltransferase
MVMWFVVDESEIANLAVTDDARRAGVGARLLDHALEAAQQRGCRVVFLEVRESNAAARGLYASRGFEVAGRRSKYYRKPIEDALVLRRGL